MARRAGPLAEISPGDAEISASGLEKFSYKTRHPGNRAENYHSAHVKFADQKERGSHFNMAAVESSPDCESNAPKTRKRKQFRWDEKMIENLIDSLQSYKATMLYKGLDFNGDKSHQYKEIRISMAKIYLDKDVTLFGPVTSPSLPEDFKDLSKEEQKKSKKLVKESTDLINRGNKRVMEKVKEIRQNFSKAVVSGRRSGSGKIVFEYYDKLVTLWGGSASSEPLAFGVGSDDFEEDDTQDIDCEQEVQNVEEDKGENDGLDEGVHVEEKDEENEEEEPVSKKAKSSVPRLIDSKRKHLEKSLSAAQRDQLLLKEAKDDAQFRKDLAQAMRESTESFTSSIKDISKAMTDLGQGLCRSLDMLSRSFQPPAPVNQNMFYQAPYAGPNHVQNMQPGYFHQMLDPTQNPHAQEWE